MDGGFLKLKGFQGPLTSSREEHISKNIKLISRERTFSLLCLIALLFLLLAMWQQERAVIKAGPNLHDLH